MFIRNAISKHVSKFKADFDEVFVPIRLDKSSSQTTSIDGQSRFITSSNVVLQAPESRDDLPATQFDHSEDEDDSNNQLQKRSLFQSLQHNPNASSLSIKSGSSSRAQSDSSKWNTKKKKPGNSNSPNNSSVPFTHSDQSESSQRNPLMATTLPPDPKRDDKSAATLSAISMKLKGTHDDTTNDFGQPVTSPKSPIDFPSLASSSKTTNGNGVSSMPQLKERPEFLSNSTSDSVEVIDDQQYTSETNNRPDSTPITQFPPSEKLLESDNNAMVREISARGDFASHKPSTSPNVSTPLNSTTDSTPITQPPPLPWKKLLERDVANVRETVVPGDFPSDKPSTSRNVQIPPLNSTTTDSNPISPKNNSPVKKARRKASMNSDSFLLNLVSPQVVSTEVPERAAPKSQQWRPPLRSLPRINELGDSLPPPDDTLARKMEDLGRLRRMESRNQITPSQSKAELRPPLQTLQEDNSSDVATLLREAYVERQQALQTQLNRALADLRDVQAENKRLTSENRSQKGSISQLKIALDEAKVEQDKLRVATSSLTRLNEEKKGWQDKLDSMHHKVTAAERQVRCLDHLTRYKFESRQEAGYGQPKRRGQFASVSASTDVIGAMRALNEEIYQTCVQFVEGLERTGKAIFPIKQKQQVQKVLGVHLTAMMEDQAKKATSGYNMLLMQSVLEVFMTHWCWSIVEAFYPPQESFADLLVQLSAQTTQTLGVTAICGKQIKIIQSSTPFDNVEFNEWVKDIIKDLKLFLTIAGLRIQSQYAILFSTKTLAVVKVAYDLRTAMAEKDICGGLEAVVIPPDTPFQEKFMMDAHAGHSRKVDAGQSSRVVVDFVAGTSGIGLQRKVSERVDGQLQTRTETELKPKVILARALNFKS